MAESTELKKKEQTKRTVTWMELMEASKQREIKKWKEVEASKQRKIKKWKEEIAIAKRELAEPSLSLKRQQYLEDRILFRETWIKEHKEKMQLFGLKRGGIECLRIHSTLPGSSHFSASSSPLSYGDNAVSSSDESGEIQEFSDDDRNSRKTVVHELDLAEYFGTEPVMRMTTVTSDYMIKQRLIKLFGENEQFTEEMASKMKAVMIEDLDNDSKQEYMSSAGLALLFERAGGKLTEAMADTVAAAKNSSHVYEELVKEF